MGCEKFIMIDEYSMLREEILQHIREFQTLRNMMYTVTVSIIVLVATLDLAYYFYLLPLIAVVPSFLLGYVYRKHVAVNAIYLRVFYEEPDSGYHWESRLAEFNDMEKEAGGLLKRIRLLFSEYASNFPYVLSAIACFMLYFYFAKISWRDAGGGWDSLWRFLRPGVVCILICAILFVVFWSVNKKKIYLHWQEVKKKECQ